MASMQRTIRRNILRNMASGVFRRNKQKPRKGWLGRLMDRIRKKSAS